MGRLKNINLRKRFWVLVNDPENKNFGINTIVMAFNNGDNVTITPHIKDTIIGSKRIQIVDKQVGDVYEVDTIVLPLSEKSISDDIVRAIQSIVNDINLITT